MHISKSERYYNAKSELYHFYVKANILQNFHICISVYDNGLRHERAKEKYKIQNKFKFGEVYSDEVRKIIQSLNRKKSAITSYILVKHLTESVYVYLPFLADIINQSLKNGVFPNELKLPEVITLFKNIHLTK